MEIIATKPIVDGRDFLKVENRKLGRMALINGRFYLEIKHLNGSRGRSQGEFAYVKPESIIALLERYVQRGELVT